MTYSYTIKTEDGMNRICTFDPQDGYVEIQAGSATSDTEYQSILRNGLKTREQKQSGSKTLSQILLKHLRMTFTLLVKLKEQIGRVIRAKHNR